MKYEINKQAFRVEWNGKMEWVVVSDEKIKELDYCLIDGDIMKATNLAHFIDHCSKITHSTIDGIGQRIEVVEEDDFKKAYVEAELSNKREIDEYSFELGYKANPKQFTEEDMIDFGIYCQDNFKTKSVDDLYNEYIQFKQPKYLEMEEVNGKIKCKLM